MHYLGLVRITFIRNISVTLFNVGLKIMAATWLLKNTSSFFPLVRFNTQECDDPVSSSLNTHDLLVLGGHWDRNRGGKVNKELSNICRLFIPIRVSFYLCVISNCIACIIGQPFQTDLKERVELDSKFNYKLKLL